jgi:hypothetical protein
MATGMTLVGASERFAIGIAEAGMAANPNSAAAGVTSSFRIVFSSRISGLETGARRLNVRWTTAECIPMTFALLSYSPTLSTNKPTPKSWPRFGGPKVGIERPLSSEAFLDRVAAPMGRNPRGKSWRALKSGTAGHAIGN